MTQLSARANKALELLKQGAEFRDRLERDAYTGRVQFKMSLVLNGKRINGFGRKTYYELASMLCHSGGGTSVSTYYKLNEV